jgi:exoribonuclease-2
MSHTTLREGSLVLYKNRPARITRAGAKLEIETEGGGTLKVRPKDVTCLHPGPLERLDDLRPPEGARAGVPAGEIKTAWELLIGDTASLAELAELAYGAYTPVTAWAAWELVADGLYFHGTPEQIMARLPEDVAREQAVREARAAERQAWSAFLERVQAGEIAPQDSPYLQDIEALALRQRSNSRVLRELGRAERPENAHALLLELGHWDEMVNPYPQRLGVETTAPDAALPELPEEERLDLTHLAAFAIDDEGNQDPDDALSLDGERLWVHVADVAALVPPQSAADQEARARGANLYLPEGTAPMLPLKATQLLGLGLDAVSPALSFGLDLDADANVLALEVVPSWVRVTRMTYAEAEGRLEQEPLRSLYRLAQTHEARRRAKGAIVMDLPEVKIRVADGSVVIRPLPPFRSRGLVTEAMLMAGGAAAQFALEHDIPFPFSTQDPPASEVTEMPTSLAGMFELRRSLQRSQMTSVPAPHAGLGMPLYAQVTSPLRRYLDLVAHQQLRAHLGGQAQLSPQEILERVGAAEAITGSVRQAERLANRHWTLVYLLQQAGWRGTGVLVDKHYTRGTVLIPDLDLEPRVHLREDLPLDSTLSLVLQGVDLAELEAHFQVAGLVTDAP